MKGEQKKNAQKDEEHAQPMATDGQRSLASHASGRVVGHVCVEKRRASEKRWGKGGERRKREESHGRERERDRVEVGNKLEKVGKGENETENEKREFGK